MFIILCNINQNITAYHVMLFNNKQGITYRDCFHEGEIKNSIKVCINKAPQSSRLSPESERKEQTGDSSIRYKNI